MNCFMLADTDDHLTRLSPVILNLESTGFTHLEATLPAINNRIDSEERSQSGNDVGDRTLVDLR